MYNVCKQYNIADNNVKPAALHVFRQFPFIIHIITAYKKLWAGFRLNSFIACPEGIKCLGKML